MESYFRGTEVNIENANKKVLISKKKKKERVTWLEHNRRTCIGKKSFWSIPQNLLTYLVLLEHIK